MGRKIYNLFFLYLYSVFGRFQVLPSVQGREAPSSLFILGDSSVNCGDNSFLYPFFGGNSSADLCNSTNPRLVPHFLAEKMGLPPTPAFYRQNGTVEGLLDGLNFGSSPATIMNYGWLGFQGLNQQARQVFETLQLLQLQLGLERAQGIVQSSVFYLSFGKDDFIHFFDHLSGVRKTTGGRKFASILSNQLTRVVEDLYNANVRKIICMGMGPLGCTPRSLWEAFNSTARIKAGCIDEINEVVVTYNRFLSANLLHLNSELKDAQIIFCDVYKATMEMINHPQIYGFENVRNACCGIGRYGGMAGCISKQIACAEESSHLWWDLYNPTEAVNLLVADWMWSGNICQPMTIKQMAYPVAVAPD